MNDNRGTLLPNLSVETNFKYLKALKNRLNKISLFMESIDYNLFINIDGFFHQVDKDHVERDNLLDSICDKYNINILHISENDLLNKDFDLKGLLVNYNEVTK